MERGVGCRNSTVLLYVECVAECVVGRGVECTVECGVERTVECKSAVYVILIAPRSTRKRAQRRPKQDKP